MEEMKDKKDQIRNEVVKAVDALSADDLTARVTAIENQLFDFANFLEARIVLLYIAKPYEVPTEGIFKRCLEYHKIVVLPVYDAEKDAVRIVKLDNPDTDLKPGPDGRPVPDPERCKVVPVECIEIAIIPGIAFDEKGGRLGGDDDYYRDLISSLPATTRKVSLALECQLLPQIPMEFQDKPVDIIITEKRVIYKI